MKKLFSLIWGLILAGISALLTLMNPDPVTLHLPYVHFQLPLGVLLSIAFALGMILVGLMLWPGLLRQRWQIRRLEKRLKRQEDETVRLRQQLLEQQHRSHLETLPAKESP